ncbi:MAG: DUF3037 domain-containing protein [Chloroflexota bacterium]|nr:DUF3037 domain-containing protein [Dehalococcoidia bacterium]MDW8255278.1 DUF3037 domain-containing protein [Chloroflexota bacterium]
MPGREVFHYSVLKVVPSVERGECFNVGVVLLCRTRRFLAARTWLDRRCLAVLAPDCDPDLIQQYLEAFERIAAGDRAAGAIARLAPAERFHWLVAPSSTVLQPGPVHSGLCDDPAAALDHLFKTVVLRPGRAAGAPEPPSF